MRSPYRVVMVEREGGNVAHLQDEGEAQEGWREALCGDDVAGGVSFEHEHEFGNHEDDCTRCANKLTAEQRAARALSHEVDE